MAAAALLQRSIVHAVHAPATAAAGRRHRGAACARGTARVSAQRLGFKLIQVGLEVSVIAAEVDCRGRGEDCGQGFYKLEGSLG